MKPTSKTGQDPASPEIVAAERLVLAKRSSRSADIGGEDSSLGDLICVLVGGSEAEALALVAIELEVLGRSARPSIHHARSAAARVRGRPRA
jgi:hypothetical protein